MTDKQENKLSMYRATETVLNDNIAIWTGNALFTTVKTALSAKIAALLTARQRQQEIITGIATDKQVLRKIMTTKAGSIAAKVVIYAEDTNNNELLNEVKVGNSRLDKERDDAIAGICQNILDHANDNLVALAAYGITAPMLADLQTAITTYAAKVPKPRVAQAAKKAVTTEITNLIKDIDKTLKVRVDKLMEDYKTTETEFYNTYKSAREIIDLGATHTKMEVKIYSIDGSTVQNAYAFLLQNNIILYSATSDADGKVIFPKVKPGTYALKVWGKKFTPKEETGIKFKAGKKVTRKVTLLPGSSTPGDNTFITEGDVAPGIAFNVVIENVKPTITSNVTIQVTGSVLRVYVSTTNNGLPADVYIDVMPGTDYTNTVFQFAQQLGFGNDNKFLMVQNLGANDAHFNFTFDNLEE